VCRQRKEIQIPEPISYVTVHSGRCPFVSFKKKSKAYYTYLEFVLSVLFARVLEVSDLDPRLAGNERSQISDLEGLRHLVKDLDFLPCRFIHGCNDKRII
jgi:hypothetical protein